MFSAFPVTKQGLIFMAKRKAEEYIHYDPRPKNSLIHVPPNSVMCISLVHLQTEQMSCISLRFIMFCPWQAWNWNGNSLLRTLKTEEAINSMLRILAMRKSSTRYSQAWGHSHCKEFEPYQPVQMWQNHFHITSHNGNRDIIYFIPRINVPVGISHLL